ncbi:DNA-deoxyinosine glycosylase [Reinekea blandensis]|uniref:Uracil-DNA glycosylase-like domain-containing protein n=1 Tax=Reinekea blandensis MED297 TaxID=314283 RepID=A4B987_9GAMM|nr:DNA-deoxyinosine glycosylase [Reinekea blandensis]EAR11188.1 hypothetical protein MED297_19912 [Reinekea sp. MED297] [Reinekea blandensis MED297]
MNRVESFALAAGEAPRVLVLGSMPGVASLTAVQYYAHPRNAFWPIMADFFGFDRDAPYDDRLAALLAKRVALWDVLQSCVRPGSLDSAIERDSMVPNPIDSWMATQPSLQTVLLNGGRAATEFRRYFKAILSNPNIEVVTLPSTSPAYAAMRFEEKRDRWHHALHRALQPS